MKTITVFCGTSAGNVPAYREAAVELGRILASEKIKMVYGGGKTGLMGLCAGAVLEHGGEVTGVITRELQQAGLGLAGDWPGFNMVVTGTMAQRKMKMFELSDGFVALPGGFGTMDEIFEALTFTQLNLHHKPCAILNSAGFYDHLLRQIATFIRDGFITKEHRAMLLIEDDPHKLIAALRRYRHTSGDIAGWVLEQLE